MPKPAALRLVTRAQSARPPRPLLGLAGWAETAEATAVLVDATSIDVTTDVGAVAAQLPGASELPGRQPVIVLGHAAGGPRSWVVVGRRRTALPRDVACTALLVRGYVDIGAGVDPVSRQQICWGWSRR